MMDRDLASGTELDEAEFAPVEHDAPPPLRPQPLRWGAPSARQRGAIITGPDTHRNAIGIHAGAFAPYRALANASGALDPEHRPDLTDTEPTENIGPFQQWSDPARIVTLDPWGHRVASDFAREIAAGVAIKPSIAVASGRLNMAEIAQARAAGRLTADGEILDREGGLSVTKIAIEPVWYLPGLARRLGLDEMVMREALVSCSGGMYPELVERPDLKVFLPSMGGVSVYLIGDPKRLGNQTTKIACRIHDECNGSDVFGSDLCTCRSYLAYGVEDCVRTAQEGGIGIIVYNRNEGRALGEVVKYLVYNARPRAAKGDTEDQYFARTEAVAGVQDLRQQRLTVDVLHWLGVTSVDRWLSMSNMKRDALTQAGIEVVRQIELPDHLVDHAARIEIGAKKAAGYFSARKTG